MPQITVHYTENLPSSDDTYKTRRFTVELTQEVADNSDINSITERMFAVAKSNVQAQVERAKGDMALREMNGMKGNKNAPAAPQSPPSSSQKPASSKQIKYLLELAKKAGMDEASIRSLPSEFQKSSFEALSSSEASKLIDSFSKKKAA